MTVAAITACDREAPQGELDHLGLAVSVESLIGDVFAADSLLGLPIRLASTAEYVLVSDARSELPIHLLDIESGARLGGYGTLGDGPGEFRRPDRIFFDATTATAWVFDRQHQRMTGVPIDRFKSLGVRDSLLETVPFRADVGFTTLGLLESGDWIGTGLIGDARFTRVARDGEVAGSFGEVPAIPDVPGEVAGLVRMSTLAPYAPADRIVVAGLLAGRIEICSLSGTCERVMVPYEFEPSVRVSGSDDNPRIGSNQDTRTAYVDVFARQEAIYALFSGRSDAAYPDAGSFGRFVHVFSWNGELLRVFELDRAAIALALDATGERLFTAIDDPLPAVMVYDLPTGSPQ